MTNEELAKRIYSGQNELMGELYTQNRGIIFKYAKMYYNKHSERCTACGVETDDLLNQSFFALPSAVTAYNQSNEGYKFLTFIKYPLLKCYNELTGYRTKKGYEEPLNNCMSLDEPVPGNDDICRGDTIPHKDADFEETILKNITLSGIVNAVKTALRDYDGYFDVICMRYIMNMPQHAIADKLGCNDSDIHQIIYKAMRILRHPGNKIVAAYRDEIIGASYHMGGLGRFKRTNQSSVEWSVIKMNEGN